METASEEEEREDNEEEEEEEEDTRSSEEEGGLSPVAMTTEPVLIEKIREDAEIQKASKQESPQQEQQEQQEGGKGVCTEWLCVLRGSLIKELVIFSRLY